MKPDFELRLHNALLAEAATFVPHDGYSMRTSPRFWRGVFERMHGEPPRSDADKRWDELFRSAFPIYRQLFDAH